MAQLGLGIHRTPRNLGNLGLGSAGDNEPTLNCALTENWGVWAAWAWEEQEIQGPPVTVPSWSTQELERLDLRSAHHLGLWETLCCPFTTRAPHKSQGYLFAVFLPLHNTTEQVTLNKGLQSPLPIKA